MAPPLRKLVLTTHLVASVGWFGAALSYVALGVAATNTHDSQLVRASWTAMELTGWFVIVPLAMAALLTGLALALGTGWGLLQHYWVAISLGLTILAATITVLHMPSVTSQATFVRSASDGELAGGLGGDLFHPSIGVLVLLVITVLNVYKPSGRTGVGRRERFGPPRKRSEQPTARLPE